MNSQAWMNWVLVALLALSGLGYATSSQAQPAKVSKEAAIDAAHSAAEAMATDVATEHDTPREQILTITIENDALTRSGDGYYTNGLRAAWVDADGTPPALVHEIIRRIPLFDAARATIPRYSIGQSIFTPREIKPFANQPADRPYAGYTYASVALTAGDGQKLDDVELTAGWVGPGAGGELIQRRYHEAIGVQKPNGWNNQLKDEPTLGLSWQRRWPGWAQANLGEARVALAPYIGGTVGNVYTHARAGATASWQLRGEAPTDTPIRVAPGIPGTGYFTTTERVNVTLFASAEGRAVARNIFLDGNTFRESPSVNKKALVGDLSGGVMLTYNRYQVGYTTVYRTKEFAGQPKGQLFGALSVGFKF
jgi:lipid A 3-O-deacylase